MSDKFLKSVSLSYKLFKNKIKKSPILVKDGEALFNAGAYRAENGEYYLYTRTAIHHSNYTSWIRLYKSNDGMNFTKDNEFFIYPQYTIQDYSYGCEDDRCSKINEWFVHNYTYLLAKDPTNPSKNNFDHYIAVSLGQKADDAIFSGIIDMKANKDGACFQGEEKLHLIHRPSFWAEPASIWYGDFTKGFEEAKKNYYDKLKKEKICQTLPKLSPPVNNRILLSPLQDWDVDRMGLGAQTLPYKGKKHLFTYHVCHNFYQYWWSVGTIYEKDGELIIDKLLPIPLCIPDTPWELIGDVPKVSFICGITQNNNTIEAWYGASDTWIMKLEIDADYLDTVLEKYGIGESEIKENIQKYLKNNRNTIENNELLDKDWYSQLIK